MDDKHILNIGNPYKVIRCLEHFLSAHEIFKIHGEIKKNVRQLVKLSNAHYQAAKRAIGLACWRQRVSRAYYACYCMSRAIRLGVKGIYNTKPNDHESIGDLPSDFPSKNDWSDFLIKFRGDRNIADYDHTECRRSLEMSDAEYMEKTQEFLREAKNYLKIKGHL
jgi:uncharacterized protein (UPF0332 family)